MDDKSQKTIADYVGDMVAVNGHIEEALDRQLTIADHIPTANAAIHRFHDLVKQQRDALMAYQKEIGGTAGSPIKEAGAAVLGVAAGLIDKIRTESVSKALRDDYTAFNLAAIGYTMLHATAVALGDQRTAEIAHKGLDAYAGAVQEINHIIGEVVVAELKNDKHQITNGNAAQENRKMVDHAWQENKSSQSGMMAGMGDSYSSSQATSGV